jgi:type II secretory ATPase GspE/PulE/Tfp pilus assembly ATPase PilB-like protein
MAHVDLELPTPEVLALIPRRTAIEQLVLPLQAKSTELEVALPQGHSKELLADLAFLVGKGVKPRITPQDVLEDAIRRAYSVSEEEFEAIRSGVVGAVHDRSIEPASRLDGSVVDMVHDIIEGAIKIGSSDIHVEPYEESIRVRYRLDGVLHEVHRPPMDQAKALVSRLKIMAGLDIAEKRRPQDGRIRFEKDKKTIDIRVSTLPTDFGEKVVLRILDKSHVALDLAKLGMDEKDLALFRKIISLPYGMILLTGPTGSGKTTTLYAALQAINSPDVNITTIEDPIEYNLEGINQTRVHSEIGLTFAAVLRSVLRQDPDVVMVGEIRDGETAQIALRAAMTGHLVFSTLHTNDAPSALARLVDMGVEPYLVASSVKLIVAQRLVRKLCTNCRELHQPTPDELASLGLVKHPAGGSFYRPKGCARCGGFGYRGRSAVSELLEVSNGIAEAISHNLPTSELRSRALASGMRTLRQAAVEKAVRGITSIDEVLRETIG